MILNDYLEYLIYICKMENVEELEKQIIKVLKIQFERTGGANGTDFADVDAILKMSIEDRNAFLSRMETEKKIIYISPLNGRTLSLPK